MKHIALAFTALFLFSCANTADKLAGIGQVSEFTDTYNNSRVVEVSPTWVTAETDKDMATSKLGASWNSASPDKITLILEYNSSIGGGGFLGYDAIKIRIDGEEFEYQTGPTNMTSSEYNTVSGRIYTESKARAVIPKSVFDKMMQGDDVRIRVLHTSTYEDMVFHREMSGWGQKMAKARFKELQQAI